MKRRRSLKASTPVVIVVVGSKELPDTPKVFYAQMLLSYPRCSSSLQVLEGGIHGSVVLLTFPDQSVFIQGPDKGLAHTLLPDLNLAICLDPPCNGRVGGFQMLCHR